MNGAGRPENNDPHQPRPEEDEWEQVPVPPPAWGNPAAADTTREDLQAPPPEQPAQENAETPSDSAAEPGPMPGLPEAPPWQYGPPNDFGAPWGAQPALPPDAFASPSAPPPAALSRPAPSPSDTEPAAPSEDFYPPVPPPPYANPAAPSEGFYTPGPPPTYTGPTASPEGFYTPGPPPPYTGPTASPEGFRPPVPPPPRASPAPLPGDGPQPLRGGLRPAEPWVVHGTGQRRRSRRPLVVIGAVTALSVAIGGGAFYLIQADDPAPTAKTDQARVADDLFTVDPRAKSDAVNQAINDVESVGGTIVAVGTEYGGIRSRARFIVSTDDGRSWQTGSVKAHDGGEPTGSAPNSLAGAAGAWLALSGSPSHMTIWTSRNGRDWIEREGSTSTFAEGDTVQQVTRTSGGYFAVGYSSKTGQDRPIAWTSPDGNTWERLEGDRLNLPVQEGSVAQMRLISSYNGVMVAGGTVATQREAKGKKRQIVVDGFWRSTDGGRAWESVTVPQAAGSAGLARGLAVTTGGFFVLRQGSQGGHGIVLGSPDGSAWQQAGRITSPVGAEYQRFAGGDRGLTALASGKNDHLLVSHSKDGGNWRRTADLGTSRGRFIDAIAPVGDGSTVLAGARNGPDKDFYLSVVDGSGRTQEIDLDRVAGVANVDRTVRDLTAADGLVIAVGGTMGDAAVWSSRNGASSWVRAQTESLGGGGRQLLYDVVKGPAGWLAIGDDAGRPLLATSANGDAWQRLRDPIFTAEKGTTLRTAAIAQGPQGYIVAGSETKNGVQSAAVWHSRDAKTWARVDGGDLTSAGGAWRWMADVTFQSPGHVAVGAIADPAAPRGQMARPAVWTSADGGQWAVRALPLPQGATHANLIRVAAKGTTAVALGVAYGSGNSFVFAVRSGDGGRTWSPADLPRQTIQGEAYGPAIKVIPTAKGFAAVGMSGSPAGHDVALWTSTDGQSWKPVAPKGTGLSGAGAQLILGLAEVNGTLTGVGLTASARDEHATLWRTPVP